MAPAPLAPAAVPPASVTAAPQPAPSSLPPTAAPEPALTPTSSAPSPTRRAEAERVVGPAADLASIRETLAHYEHAYEALDARAAAAIWPSLDIAALSRAFEGLKSQSLSFERCTFTLGYQSAIATCSGTTTVLPRIGSSSPIVESLRWTFALQRSNTSWQIESIKTSH